VDGGCVTACAGRAAAGRKALHELATGRRLVEVRRALEELATGRRLVEVRRALEEWGAPEL
jgi:hypothetical protein